MKRLNFKLTSALLLLTLLLSGCATVPYQPQARPPYGVYHIVGSAQTLYRIARTYNVDINEIMRANRITDPTQIGVGQQLFIPGARSPLLIEPYRPITQETLERLAGPKYRSSRWRCITMHHIAQHLKATQSLLIEITATVEWKDFFIILLSITALSPVMGKLK